MNQDILNLYKKAQNAGLNAQEVFWLEGQAASHPCFGMAYMILARHHYRNQSTIKNKALLKAAAYANNRSLLRNYLEDTLTVPKSRPIPVSEMKPVLEKRDSEQATPAVNFEKKEETPTSPPESTEVSPSLTTVAEITSLTVVDPTPPHVTAEETPVMDSITTDEISSVIEEKEIPETSSASKALEPIAESEPKPNPEYADSENSVNSVNSAPPTVNWFLQMRVKLRADKFKSLGNRIRTSIEKHAPALTASAEATPSSVAALATESVMEAPMEAPVTESVMEAPMEAPANESELQAPAPEAPMEAAVPETEAIESPAPLAGETITVATDTPPLEPAEVIQQVEAAKESPEPATVTANAGAPQQESKVKKVAPEKEYEIGAFSSFTFLSEGESDDSEEVIDTGIATLEAVEFQTIDFHDGIGEIIFEENDRVVEITVSPEALSKYFKGRLPSEQPMTFGEFKIEFDELEYRSTEPQAALETEPKAHEAEAELPTNAETEAQTSEQPKKKVNEILEKFIENEPAITRGNLANSPVGDLAKDSHHLHEDWVTETLARIYAKQGNKAKAIKIYGKLRLRFPEKSDYFGTLIENLKQ